MKTTIAKIDEYDASSTYFRYPSTKTAHLDGEKSGVVEADPIEVLKEMWAREDQKPPSMPEGPFDFDTFVIVGDRQPELRAVLVEGCKSLSGCAFGLHAELVDGIGKRIRDSQGDQERTDDAETPEIEVQP